MPAAHLFAQRPPQPPAPRSEAQARAEALLARARHISDLRAGNAPAFRLKATFSFIDKSLDPVHGTYTEVWVSDSRWRRETSVGSFHRVEVGTPKRIWTLDSTPDFPEKATRMPALMNIFPPPSATFEFESVTDTPDQKPAQQCATTKPGSRQEQYRFCFDQKSGAIVATLSPDIRPQRVSDYSCVYGIFRKFGDSWFPREMACLKDKHRDIEAKVEELVAEPSPDAVLFKPPPGAIELGVCSGITAQPVPTFTPQPGFPTGAPNEDSSVVLSAIVDTRGQPQNLKVTQSGGRDFNEAALHTAWKWRYKPGTCDGDPMPMETGLELNFIHQNMGGGGRVH